MRLLRRRPLLQISPLPRGGLMPTHLHPGRRAGPTLARQVVRRYPAARRLDRPDLPRFRHRRPLLPLPGHGRPVPARRHRIVAAGPREGGPRVSPDAADLGAGGFDGRRLWWQTAGALRRTRFHPAPPRLRTALPLPGSRAAARCTGWWRCPTPTCEVRCAGRADRWRWRGAATATACGATSHCGASPHRVALGAGSRRGPRRRCGWPPPHRRAGWPRPGRTASVRNRDSSLRLPGRAGCSWKGRSIDLEGLHLGPLRAPLGRLLHAPRQVKQASAASHRRGGTGARCTRW